MLARLPRRLKGKELSADLSAALLLFRGKSVVDSHPVTFLTSPARPNSIKVVQIFKQVPPPDSFFIAYAGNPV
jgi:hypothetical protein